MQSERCYLYQAKRGRYSEPESADASRQFFGRNGWIHVVTDTKELIDLRIMSQFMEELGQERGQGAFQVRALKWLDLPFRILSLEERDVPLLEVAATEYSHSVHNGIYRRRSPASNSQPVERRSGSILVSQHFPFYTAQFRTLKAQPVPQGLT